EEGLPAAAGEAGDRNAFRIDEAVSQEDLEAAAERQVEDGGSGLAGQVEKRQVVVAVVVAGELSGADPFEVEGEHAASGKVDAADLLIVDGHALAADVAVNVEDAGEPAGGAPWLV